MLKVTHDSDLSGHCGVKRTLKKLYQCMTWPNISQDISKYVKECVLCQKQAKCHSNKAP